MRRQEETRTDVAYAGDDIPSGREVIEVHVAELRQLFNAIDPSPFRDRDLDAAAEEFIVGWSKDVSRDTPLALLVFVDRAPGLPSESGVIRDAIHAFFSLRAQRARRHLRQLFRRARISLVIGLTFLGLFIGVGNLVVRWLQGSHLAEVLREGFLIGGWVAMWRPLELFLYDWWPIRADVRLFDRLAAMPVRIGYRTQRWAEASRQHSAAAPPAGGTSAARAATSDIGGSHDDGIGDAVAASEAALDGALEDTFPASDPLSSQVPSIMGADGGFTLIRRDSTR